MLLLDDRSGVIRHCCRPSRGSRRRPRPARRPSLSAWGSASRSPYDGDDLLDRLGDRDAVLLGAVAVAERDRAGRDVVGAGDQHERHLLLLGVADLLLHAIVGSVDLDPDALLGKGCCDTAQVVDVLLADRDADDLHRREPGREGAGVVLGQHREEPLDRAEQRAVDHHRAVPLAVAALVLELEPLGQVEVELDRRHLPGAPDRVARLHRDLRPVERSAARVGDELRPDSAATSANVAGRGLPVPRRRRRTSPGSWSTARGRSRRGRSRAAGRARRSAACAARRACPRWW